MNPQQLGLSGENDRVQIKADSNSECCAVHLYMEDACTSVQRNENVLLYQELGSGGKKSDASEEWRNQSVEDRLEYALVRV